MKITTPEKKPRIIAPDLMQVLVLSSTKHKQGLLVFRCPTPHKDYFLFVGEGSNSYLAEDAWDRFMNGGDNTYSQVGLYKIANMEVTINA